VLDVPGYARPLLLTDAAINISPSLAETCCIVQNAIDLAHVLGIETPRVAILAAEETVNPAMRATVDAAALCKKWPSAGRLWAASSMDRWRSTMR
jgi:phosphate butyryltransferase